MKKPYSSEEEKSVRVYTKLKFIKSEQTGALVGFVSQNPKTNRICGVHQESPYPKKICVVDKVLAATILTNVLYDCTLVKMAEKEGYVVIAAEPVQFTAHIVTTHVKKSVYTVEVKFGNKVIRFDPFNGKKDTIRDLVACKGVLEKRVDVKNLMQVVADFEREANNLLTLMYYETRRRQ